MLEILSLLLPAVLATGWHNKLRKYKMSDRELAFTYVVYVMLINVLLFAFVVTIFHHANLVFDGRFFVKYNLLALCLSAGMPLVAVYADINIDVTADGEK